MQFINRNRLGEESGTRSAGQAKKIKASMNILVGAHSLPGIPIRFRYRVGNLFSPGSFWNCDLQFALDNYVFTSWKRKQKWDSDKFLKHLNKVKDSGKSPQWVVCPDAVGNAAKTLELWREWAPKLRAEYGWPLAFAAQDSQTIEAVPADADVIFVGGTTDWKYATIEMWCNNFPRVHVARINTRKWLWHCHNCGAESIDGTGWFWQGKREYRDLIDYLEITEGEGLQSDGLLSETSVVPHGREAEKQRRAFRS